MRDTRNQTENGSANERGSGTERETGMKGGTDGGQDGMTQRRTARAKEVLIIFHPSVGSSKKKNNATFHVHVFVFTAGKKDEEMDPMDPSAYSDAPRYVFRAAAVIRRVVTFSPPKSNTGVKEMCIKCSFLPSKSTKGQFDEFYRKYLYFLSILTNQEAFSEYYRLKLDI